MQAKQLDEIADRLGAVYQMIGRITPAEVDATAWADAMDEIVCITHDLETITGRNNRLSCHGRRPTTR